jgi:hypothetical protein
MQRLRDERGAVAVMVGLLMVPLIGFAAIAVDVAAMWSEHQQLQTGADAGALAVAQDCARGTCGSPAATAQTLALGNVNGEQTAGTIKELTTSKVTVRTSGVKTHWFAPVIGADQSAISAQATAKWGAPVGGGTFPLTFSWCEWNAQTGGLESTQQHRIVLSKTATSNCTGPSGLALPGGFGWVDPAAEACTEASMIGNILSSDTGNTPPNVCKPADFDKLLDEVILIPIFDRATGSGDHGDYRVYGYAAFKFTGYYFSGQYKHWPVGDPKLQDCSGNDRCISGYFTRYVDLNEVLDIGPGPQLGASIVTLTN